MRLAAQMYTVRDFTETEDDFDRTLQAIHGIGYEAVQLSAIKCMDGPEPLVDATRAKELLEANGLTCCATHRPWDRLRDHTDEEIRFHRTLGCHYAAIGGLWGGYDGVAGMRRFAEESKDVARKLADAGIRFGYHNHAHEFKPDPETGGFQYEVLLNEAPHLALEVDVYWVAVGGLDPGLLLASAKGRIQAIHLKDRAPETEQVPFAAIGEGDLNWDSILEAALTGGTDWGIVEQDTCPRDPFDCLDASFEFLSRRKL
jgi:sugar phosphate isomerase/epimerase